MSVYLCSPTLHEALADLILESFPDVEPLCFSQLVLDEFLLVSLLDLSLQGIFLPGVHVWGTAKGPQVRRVALKTRGEKKRYGEKKLNTRQNVRLTVILSLGLSLFAGRQEKALLS